jgi:hypothetical protein
VKLTSTCTASHRFTSFSRCTGYLDDGRRYAIHRVLLCCDDFQPHSSRTSSYGRCYMLPMGINPSQKAGYGAVGYSCLTPPQMSANEILKYIVSDKGFHYWCAGTGSDRKSCHDIHRRTWVHWRLPRCFARAGCTGP